eukprot:351937-Chlamydomonas_euryale.AAC.22
MMPREGLGFRGGARRGGGGSSHVCGGPNDSSSRVDRHATSSTRQYDKLGMKQAPLVLCAAAVEARTARARDVCGEACTVPPRAHTFKDAVVHCDAGPAVGDVQRAAGTARSVVALKAGAHDDELRLGARKERAAAELQRDVVPEHGVDDVNYAVGVDIRAVAQHVVRLGHG